ncbi:MAG: HAD-IIIA family hydrolase [Deltaproteobacteria bacterium]|nr:HAD-IIIA family hydrolase [Deltaproteobacteria bacterium]
MAVARKGVEEKIKKVRLLIFDVDGVLTDGGIIYNDAGQELKVFDVKDGHGIKLLMRAGIDAAIITARESMVVSHRAANLGIELVYQGMKDKADALELILKKKVLDPREIGYIGDDVIDLPVMKRVGFSAAVADAVEEVKERADYVTTRPGGKGAAREVIELILKTQGKWDAVVGKYLA